MKIHSYFISHRGSESATELYSKLNHLPHPPFQRDPVWIDSISWSGSAPLSEELGYALINSQWCVGCCTDDILSSEWCLLECDAAAAVNRLILYRPELLRSIPSAWQNAGVLHEDLSMQAPRQLPNARPAPFLQKASTSALIYLENRSIALLRERVQSNRQGVWGMATFELSLRALRPLIEADIEKLHHSDCVNLMETCQMIAEFWSWREQQEFELDFCDYMAPILLTLVGTRHEEMALNTYYSAIDKMNGNVEQFSQVVSQVRQGEEIWRAIFNRTQD